MPEFTRNIPAKTETIKPDNFSFYEDNASKEWHCNIGGLLIPMTDKQMNIIEGVITEAMNIEVPKKYAEEVAVESVKACVIEAKIIEENPIEEEIIIEEKPIEKPIAEVVKDGYN